MINILSTIRKVDTALFKYLVDKKICSLTYAGVHLIKGSSESKVLINEGKQGCPSILVLEQRLMRKSLSNSV